MRRSLIIVAVLALLLVIGFIYYALDPTTSGIFPRCPFLTLTGYKCPGCGSQRAFHALLNGEVAAAFRYNAMLFISVPCVALLLLIESLRTSKPRLYLRINTPLLSGAFLALILGWWLMRNIFDW